MTRLAHFVRSFAHLAFIGFVTMLLALLWADAASASECARQPLTQAAREHETVLVCTGTLPATRTVGGPVRRPGVTTVVHYGHRAPTYTITYLVSR